MVPAPACHRAGPSGAGAAACPEGSERAIQVQIIPAPAFPVTPAPQTDGTVDVTVTNAAGTSPASGPMDGGATVTITGAWFTNAFRVKFGNTAAASFHVDSSTQITAVTPYHDAGTVDASVTTDVDTSPVVAADQYTFMPGP